MEETVLPSPAPSTAELIEHLEKHVIDSMDTMLADLQSLQKEKKLDQETLKIQTRQVLNLAQASLLIRTLPLLIGTTPLGESLQTADLFDKVHQAAERIKGLFRDQTIQAIDNKAAKVLEQIEAKERKIREEINQKQKAISQVVHDKMKGPSPTGR